MNEDYPTDITIDGEKPGSDYEAYVACRKKLNIEYLFKNEMWKLTDNPISHEWIEFENALGNKTIFKG